MGALVHLGPCHDLGPLWLFGLSAPDRMAGLPGSKVR